MAVIEEVATENAATSLITKGGRSFLEKKETGRLTVDNLEC